MKEETMNEEVMTYKDWQIRSGIDELQKDIIIKINREFDYGMKDLKFSEKCYIAFTALTYSMANIILNFDVLDEVVIMKLIDDNTKKLKLIIKEGCKNRSEQKDNKQEGQEDKTEKQEQSQ